MTKTVQPIEIVQEVNRPAQGLRAVLIAAPEESRLLLIATAIWPTLAITPTAIAATITAYSTAVGPSSLCKNLRKLFDMNFVIFVLPAQHSARLLKSIQLYLRQDRVLPGWH